MDINDPRNPNNPHRYGTDLPRGVGDGPAFLWPTIAVVAALIAGLFFFGSTRTDQPTTQVGQNVERPATPNTTPTTPKTTPQ